MTRANLGDDCDVAVIGAGPYGLAVAAHLRSAKISTRVFGRPMSFWREHMPKGMSRPDTFRRWARLAWRNPHGGDTVGSAQRRSHSDLGMGPAE